MNATARALVLTSIGAVAFRVGITDEYANYVNEWMRWPLVVSGVLLVLLAVVVTLVPKAGEDDDDHNHDKATNFVPWLLILPAVIGFVIQPPALGSYVAERRANTSDASTYADAGVAPLDADGVNDMPVVSFIARVSYDAGSTIADAQVKLTGFASSDDEGGWYVTRMAIACCAADASAFRVKVEGATAPPDDQWVEVVGTWVEGTGLKVGGTPSISVTEVTEIEAPKRPYE